MATLATATAKSASITLPETLLDAVSSSRRVTGAPHDFYRYPARFSPQFAREAITAFTNPGDLVLDPFCGGGTTVVEALSLGRRAAGMDVSTLASFLTRTKTTPISVHDRIEIEVWVDCLEAETPHEATGRVKATLETEYYERNLPEQARTFFRWVSDWLTILGKERQRNFARLVLLGVGQRLLDCKTTFPSMLALQKEYCNCLRKSLERFFGFLSDAAKANKFPRCRLSSMRRVINRSSENCENEGRIPKAWLPAKLILTSPPYPGVHMVYHRWQILGRRETPAPFMVANQRDGAGESHYLLGPRDEDELATYYTRLKTVFESLRPLLNEESIVVQLVAFSKPKWQLPSYLQTMNECGFGELTPSEGVNAGSTRIWRGVPGRKWYANLRGEIPASKEVMLLHRPV